MGKRPIKRVGGVWNIKLRIFLIGKQVGQVSLHAEIGSSDFLMGVIPAVCSEYVCFVGKTFAPPFLPTGKKFRELFSITSWQL